MQKQKKKNTFGLRAIKGMNVDDIKYFGIYLDPSLRFEKHVEHVVGKLSKSIYPQSLLFWFGDTHLTQSESLYCKEGLLELLQGSAVSATRRMLEVL